MNISMAFIRALFLLLSLIFMVTFAVGVTHNPTIWTYIWGSGLGVVLCGILVALDLFFRRFNLRAFNIAVLGLFFGYLLATAILLIFNSVLEITGIHPTHTLAMLIKIFIFLFGAYLGVMMTLRASDEIYVSLPFVKFTPALQKTKDLLLDGSTLNDPRIIDLAASGLLDKRLVLPRFLLKEYYEQEESSDETIRSRARRALDVVKKLEGMPLLNLRYQDTDFPEVKEMSGKILRLARLIDADVLSADVSRIQTNQIEDTRIINIHSLSNALKPLMQRGHFLKIKIQRQGKEEMQGVGYLEDGTMVVVNGGGHYIGELIRARVLSVKHTSSGRMIFCNVADDDGEEYDNDEEYT